MEIEVRDAGARGRGVFALRSFAPGDVIETCPVIVIPAHELRLIDGTVLYSYYFGWPEGGAIAGGLGSFYNHADTPNARCSKDYQHRTINFVALEAIRPGEEITFRYNTGGNETGLWFNPV